MKKLNYFCLLLLLTTSILGCSKDESENLLGNDTLVDIDGNIYATVTIGNQVWMAENLKTTNFNDGTPTVLNTFPNVNDWGTTTGTYQWASTLDLNNDVDENLPIDYYGAMYNEAAIASGKLAPEGWRLPTEADWIELRDFLRNEGHTGNEGTVLKTTTGWNSFSGNGSNLYGFNGLPNGYVDALGEPKADAIITT